MAERKSIFSQSKIRTIEKDVSNTLLSQTRNCPPSQVTENKIKITKGGKKKHINLTLLPDKYEKVKRIAFENKLSISVLFEQLIDQL